MALATKCPHCHTVFRVALDQLKLRGGIVRCGACNEIFDGNAALVDPGAAVIAAPLPATALPASPPPATAAAAKLDLELDLDDAVVVEEPPAAAEPDSGAADLPPFDAADPKGTDGALPDAGEESASTSAPARREPALDTPSEHLVAVALDDLHHFDDIPEPIVAAPAPAAQADRAANDAADRAADDASAADLLAAAPESALLAAGAGGAAVPQASETRRNGHHDERDDERDNELADAQADAQATARLEEQADEPEFVRQAERRERTRNLSRLAMIAGIPLLALLLLGQGVYSLRNGLAASYPALKPALQALCGPLGCTVELPRQIDALAIEQGELQTLTPGTFSFATVLRNQSRTVQAWPHIELVLNDAADKPVLRRVFAPRDYLGKPADVAAGFRPRSEQAVKLYFQLDGLRASGYHIAIFHP